MSGVASKWQRFKLGDVLGLVNGYPFKPAQWKDRGLPIIRIQNLNNAEASFNHCPETLPDKFRVRTDDLLFAWSGTPGTSFGAHVWRGGDAWLNQHIFRVQFDHATFDREFLRYAINRNLQDYIRQAHGGAGLAHITKGRFEDSELFAPPLTEQKRIVAKLEELFTNLDAGVAALKQTQAQLKRYRASVLHAACTGQLVPTEAELAKSRKTKFESGETLLARILSERRANWRGSRSYKEPARPKTTDLSILPENWTWASWEMVLADEENAFKRGPFGSALTKSIFVDKGFKVYEQYCPINDDCSFARYYITPDKFKELQAFEVLSGDYLISCSGVTLGRITRVPELFERGVINQALLRVRINEGVINHRYFVQYFRSEFFQKAIFDNSTGSAIPNVKGVKELKAMAIPLPPLAEQKRIVAEVERRLSVADEVEASVAAELQRAASLRQSILSHAFAGKL